MSPTVNKWTYAICHWNLIYLQSEQIVDVWEISCGCRNVNFGVHAESYMYNMSRLPYTTKYWNITLFREFIECAVYFAGLYMTKVYTF